MNNSQLIMPPLVLKVKLCWSRLNEVSFHGYLSQALEQHENTIVAWLCKHKDINPYTYEGGIRDWWGAGSVALSELGLRFSIILDGTCCDIDNDYVIVKIEG